MTSRDHLMGWAPLAPIIRAIEALGAPPRKPYPLGVPERIYQRGRDQVAEQLALGRPLVPTTQAVTFSDHDGLIADPLTRRAYMQALMGVKTAGARYAKP